MLTVGIFVYVAAAALAFPFEGIYLHRELGVSMSMVGVVFGLVPVAVMPMQFWGGHLTDRLGRRWVIMLSVSMGVVWFAGFAFVTEVWQVAILVAIESSLGWPLFQTASNAMVADLLPADKRQEGFSVSRVAMNLGVVVGPAAAGLALGLGVTFRELFLAAAAGCALMVALMFFTIRESRPESATSPKKHRDAQGRSGYGIVFHDRVFIVFCLVAVLPVFCIGNFGSIYSVYITDYLGVPYGEWGMLLALNAFIVATVQYPLVRATRFKNRMVLLAIASAALATGIGGSAFAGSLWSLVILIVVHEPRRDAALTGGLGRGLGPRSRGGPRPLHGRVDDRLERRRRTGARLRRLGYGRLRRAPGLRHPARGGPRGRRPVSGAGAGLEPAPRAGPGCGAATARACLTRRPRPSSATGPARSAGRGRAPLR